MNNSDLIKKIKWLGREVLALKQAFLRGVGRTDWASQSISKPNPDPNNFGIDFTLTVQFTTSGSTMPVCQFYTNIGDYRIEVDSYSWNNSTRTMVFGGVVNNYFTEDSLNIKVIATEYIQSVGLELVSR